VKERGKKVSLALRARGSKVGENNPRAKVTEYIVRQIRAFEGTNAEAARHFGVTRKSVYQIRTRTTWRHVK
jgi:hypothetical protein